MKKFIALLTVIILILSVAVNTHAAVYGIDKNARNVSECPFCGKNDYTRYIDKLSMVVKVLAKYDDPYLDENYYEEDYEEDYDDNNDDFYEEEPSQNTATVCIEAFTVGGGYIIAPVEVELYEDVNCAYILDELLSSNGIEYSNTGSLDGGFYLASVENIPEFTPEISSELTAVLESAGFLTDVEDYTPGQLAEFDFTAGSGWMYSVNGEFPNVGFSEYCLEPGDVMRIQFTLAYGSDVGDSSRMGTNIADGIFELPNRDELTKIIAEKGIENCSEYIDSITRHDLTREELDLIVEALKEM